MNERKATKRALLTSITALVMCVVMLAGTTFAWFTDTAKTNVNRIEAGKLDVQLMMKDNSGRWVNAEGETLKWVKAQGGENQAILWEPGAEYKLPELKIVNNGNLKLKYKIVITGASGDVDLLNVIDFSAEITGVNNAVFSNVNVRDNNPVVYDKALEPNKEDVIALSGKMQTSANNTYMSKTISGISITVYAAQATGEYDSISDQYDKAAAYPTVAPVLNLNTGESVTLENNALPETTIDEGGAVSTIPADTTMQNGSGVISGTDGKLERVIKTTIATNPATGVDTATYDISYNFTQNGTTTEVTEFSAIVTNVLQLASGLENVAVTHTHGSTTMQMIPAQTEDANEDGQFYYNETTGKLTIWSKQYSAFAVSYKANFAAVVNGQFFNTLPDAVAAAENGATITLVRDVAADVVIPEGKTITLDLGGHKLANVSGDTITNEGTLTITGTGTVDNVTHGKAALVNYGTATLNGGNFTRSKENAENNKDDSGGNSYYTILNDKGATMTINEGVTVSNVGHYSSMICNCGDDEADSKMTINGGTFSGGINTVKNDGYGDLTINGGDFSNTSQVVIMNWNKATISGGTFEANASAGAVLFNAKWSEVYAVGELKIEGGMYVCAKNQKLIIDRYNNDKQYLGTAVISGGTFNTDPTSYLATGYTATKDSNGVWTVTEKSN